MRPLAWREYDEEGRREAGGGRRKEEQGEEGRGIEVEGRAGMNRLDEENCQRSIHISRTFSLDI